MTLSDLIDGSCAAGSIDQAHTAPAVQSVHEAKCVNSSSDLSSNKERNRNNLSPFETKWYLDNVSTHSHPVRARAVAARNLGKSACPSLKFIRCALSRNAVSIVHCSHGADMQAPSYTVPTHGCETIEDVAVPLTVRMHQTLSSKFEASLERLSCGMRKAEQKLWPCYHDKKSSFLETSKPTNIPSVWGTDRRRGCYDILCSCIQNVQLNWFSYQPSIPAAQQDNRFHVPSHWQPGDAVFDLLNESTPC